MRSAGTFSAEERALVAGWRDAMASYGFSVAMGCAGDRTDEALFIAAPGTDQGEDWAVCRDDEGYVIERVGALRTPLFRAEDIAEALQMLSFIPSRAQPKPRRRFIGAEPGDHRREVDASTRSRCLSRPG
jgi:hypothetical protein